MAIGLDTVIGRLYKQEALMPKRTLFVLSNYYYVSILISTLILLVSCNKTEIVDVQQTQSVPNISVFGKSALEHSPNAIELARRTFPNPMLMAINIVIPTTNSQDKAISTKFHFESLEVNNAFVLVSCGEDICKAEEMPSDITLLGSGFVPVNIEEILIDSPEAIEIAISYLGPIQTQFERSTLRLRSSDRGDSIWLAYFREAGGEDFQLSISPQTGEVLEKLP